MLQQRYLIAFIVACLIFAGGAAFCAHTRRSLIEHARQQVDKLKDTDEEYEEIATMLDQGILPPDFGMEVPGRLLSRVRVADFLATFWYVWVILVFGACFAVTYFRARFQGQGGGT